MELSRLLRRALFVAAVAVAGWLLSVAFAGTASAEERPQDDTRVQDFGGVVGDLFGGLTDTVGGVTDRVKDITGTVIDTSGDVLAPIAHPPAEEESDVELPVILPAGSSSGSATADQADGLPRIDLAPTPITAPAAPVAAPPPVVPPPSTTAPVPPAVIPAPAAAPATPAAAQDLGDVAAEQAAGEGVPEPEPVKAPGGSGGGSGTTASNAHDNSGGARGTHGVLPTQSELHPADAGFTTRSRAADAAGRVAGLPASSPD